MVRNSERLTINIVHSQSHHDSKPNSTFSWINMQNKNYNWHPPTDVYETSSELVIKVEIAGMEKSDFDITIDKDLLYIRGIRHNTITNEKKAYHQVEIGFGDFTTQIKINIPIDYENIGAEYLNGFLTIKIPKALPKQIKIFSKD